ncbi:TlyA family RNA methyltransferase [Nocardioides zeae]
MPPRRLRLDAELVRRQLARSREHASELIAAGRVRVSGAVATKAATGVTTDVAIVVRDDPDRPDFVSRGGHKLVGALDTFAARGGLTVQGRRCLDAGASTGGFTDVLLRRGAAEVVAADVGYGQLAWSIRQDPRVLVRDRTNIRDLTLEHTAGPVGVVVGDLSFISLTLVLDALVAVTEPDGDLALMVKPQFEVGKERVGKGGVVRELELRTEAVVTVADAAASRGWGAVDVVTSPLPGPSGNVEFFLWLRHGAARIDVADVEAEVARGPATGEPDENADDAPEVTP